MNNALTQTQDSKLTIVLRILAGAPLFFFGVMHIIGAMPMKPLVEAAGLPMPELMAVAAPLAQILAGASLLTGAFIRLGAVVAIGTMLGAIVTHIKIPNDQWPTPSEADPSIIVAGPEPVGMLAIATLVIAVSIYTIFKGAGSFSIDKKCFASSTPTKPNSQPAS